jgi:hypothetical protein
VAPQARTLESVAQARRTVPEGVRTPGTTELSSLSTKREGTASSNRLESMTMCSSTWRMLVGLSWSRALS